MPTVWEAPEPKRLKVPPPEAIPTVLPIRLLLTETELSRVRRVPPASGTPVLASDPFAPLRIKVVLGVEENGGSRVGIRALKIKRSYRRPPA